MLKRILLAGFVVGGTTMAVQAQDLHPGWSVQFKQDSFSGDLTVGALMAETGDGFMKSVLTMVCADGAATFAFQPGGFSIANAISVEFRLPEGVRKVAFSPGDTTVGRMMIAGEADTAAMRAALEAATEALPYRTEQGQGTFPVIGASAAFKIVDDAC